ncbi:hypothetical protein M0R45_015963 [Rubus argutus]|uniref:Uncharacterized protein n=1 Tax=Rubus argutus TaxID=59490 RepID=A0AAW1XR75_RUBAR
MTPSSLTTQSTPLSTKSPPCQAAADLFLSWRRCTPSSPPPIIKAVVRTAPCRQSKQSPQVASAASSLRRRHSRHRRRRTHSHGFKAQNQCSSKSDPIHAGGEN